jgi:hypothetical protein
MFEGLRESLLGREVNLPVADLRGGRLAVTYTFFEGKPASHRVLFRKGSRPCFEVFLPQRGDDLVRLVEGLRGAIPEEAPDAPRPTATLPWWQRAWLRLVAGRIDPCLELFPGPSAAGEFTGGAARIDRGYRLGVVKRRDENRVVLIASKTGSHAGMGGRGATFELNWRTLRLDEVRRLIDTLQRFLASDDFHAVERPEPGNP